MGIRALLQPDARTVVKIDWSDFLSWCHDRGYDWIEPDGRQCALDAFIVALKRVLGITTDPQVSLFGRAERSPGLWPLATRQVYRDLHDSRDSWDTAVIVSSCTSFFSWAVHLRHGTAWRGDSPRVVVNMADPSRVKHTWYGSQWFWPIDLCAPQWRFVRLAGAAA